MLKWPLFEEMCVILHPNCVIEYSMKRILRIIGVLAVGALMTTSCLNSSDNEVTTYNDMAIKTFTLGKLNRYLHKTSSKGTDSVYKATYSASTYKMHIDQLGHRIYNTDSLLTGTDVAHVICTVTTVNNGIVYIKSLTSDSLYYFTSGSDSVDFSKDRVFRVFATDGSGYRDYVVSLNVRNQDKGVFNWVKADKAGFPAAADSVERRAAEDLGFTYLGTSSYEIYAMTPDGVLVESEDGGITWKEDVLESSVQLMPTKSLSYVTWYWDAQTDYALLVGQLFDTDEAMVLWRKLVDNNGGGRWVYMPLAGNNPYYLPRMEHVELVHYADGVLAFGCDGKIYQSRDQGITWKTTSTYKYPEGFDVTSFYKVGVDQDDYLWLTDTESGQTWKGRLTE